MAAAAHQFVVTASFKNDAASPKDDDLIGITNCRQSVSDDEAGESSPSHSLVNKLLCDVVKRASCFVKDDHLWR
ncbi:hypothetical protein, partial [Ilumatobacter sp.]|uniref:hypothetical protein n=1 Tax=Ilumatobacter sp. TaxID=1967498 RepID=UPI003F6B5E96